MTSGVEAWTVGESVDTILVFDTLKNKDLQFIMDTSKGFDSILHKILN